MLPTPPPQQMWGPHPTEKEGHSFLFTGRSIIIHHLHRSRILSVGSHLTGEATRCCCRWTCAAPRASSGAETSLLPSAIAVVGARARVQGPHRTVVVANCILVAIILTTEASTGSPKCRNLANRSITLPSLLLNVFKYGLFE